MDTDKIIQDLNRRFAAPLPEFYQRRIIFWYDEDKEFEDKLDEVVLENAKVIALTGNNAFSVKKLLSVDDLTTNYLVYSPCVYNRPDDNWLLDVELYSEEFRADLISIWMDEMGLISNPAMRKQVKNYRAYFNAKDRRLKVSTQNKVPETPAQLHMAVMAAICGLKDAQPNMILRSVFQAGLDLNNNTFYQDFVKYHADAAFWAMVRQGCGFVGEEPDLGRLAIHLLLTAATRTMRQEYLAGLDGFISMPHQAYCYDFISEWLHSDNIPQLYDVARYVEDEARLYQRFEKLTVEDLVGTECFPCINEVILTKLMTEISDHIIDVDTITNTVEKRRTCVWYEPFENFYDGILQVANMQSFFKEHSAGFHTAEAKSIWKEYTESYYQMDTYYRLFHLSFQKSLETSNILLDDLFKHVVDKVEGLYTHWFLGELGNNWSDVCADELATYGKVLEVPQQEDFYRSRIQTSDTKVFVIISDAMRYEVAATMADQLQRETQSKVSISSMQSIFPSTTKFGMAALLPHKELTVEVRNDILTVLADGQSTASTYRDKVLKTEEPASVALKYNDIIAMKRAERSALVKGMDVVYIYHDTIDEASHTSDTAVFAACDKAISELKNLVRIIVNEFGGTNILITADHGFLYTYSPLKGSSYVELTRTVLKTIYQNLDNDVLGQDKCKKQILSGMYRLTTGTHGKPVVLMLYGPSGVGKTESAKSISKSLGGELLRIQFSMMQTEEAFNYVFGAEHSKSSFARDMVGRESNVILIDEFDKVNPAFYNAFYELFDEGRYVDTNYDIDLGQAVFLLTCNFGSETEIKKALGPAMFSRIGSCIEYADLTVEQKQIIINNWYSSILKTLQEDEKDFIQNTDVHEWFIKNAGRYDNIRILKGKMENAIFEKLTEQFIISK